MHRRLTAVAVGIAVVMLDACGGSSSSKGDRLAIVAHAPAATLAAKTVQMTTKTQSTKGGANGAGLTVTSSGVFDFVTKAGTFAVDLGSLGAGGGTAEFRLLGRIIYFKAPPGTLAAGKQWLKIDLDDKSDAAAAAGLTQFASADPSTALSFLKGVTGDAKVLGTESLHGTKTTHYAVVVDTAKAAAAAEEQAKPLLDQTLARGINSVPTELWIDTAGRLRRVKQRVDMSKSTDESARQSGTITTTIDMFEFGTKVDVAAPPDGETESFLELQSQSPPPTGG